MLSAVYYFIYERATATNHTHTQRFIVAYYIIIITYNGRERCAAARIQSAAKQLDGAVLKGCRGKCLNPYWGRVSLYLLASKYHG